jgi:hypothetical protein
MARKHSLTLALIHKSRLRAAVAGDIESLTFFFLFSTRYSLYGLAIQISSAIVKSRRGLRTGSRPMESCRPAIIVSFGVTAHWRGSSPKRKRGGTVRVGEAGIDSVAEFRGCLTVYRSGVHDSKHSCPAPVKRGRAVTILFFLTIRQGRGVSNRSLVFCSAPVVPSPSGISLPSLRMELECY